MVRFSDAMNQNLVILEQQMFENPLSIPILLRERRKVKKWIEERNNAIVELTL